MQVFIIHTGPMNPHATTVYPEDRRVLAVVTKASLLDALIGCAEGIVREESWEELGERAEWRWSTERSPEIIVTVRKEWGVSNQAIWCTPHTLNHIHT